VATLGTRILHQRAEHLISVFLGHKRSLRKTGEKLIFMTNDGGEPWTIKFVPATESHRLASEAYLLHLIKEMTSVPVANMGELDADGEYSWLITQRPQGVTLTEFAASGAECRDLYTAAGRMLADLHKMIFSIPDHHQTEPMPVWCEEEFKAIIGVLYNFEIIDEYTLEQWRLLDIDRYFDVEDTFCHGNFCGENIIVNHGEIMAIQGFDWSGAGPWVADLAAMDVSSKIVGLARYMDVFYRGYQQIRPLSEYFLAHVEFYRFYHTCLSLAYRQKTRALLDRLEWYQTSPRFTKILK